MGASKKLKKRQIKLILPGILKKESHLQTFNALEKQYRELRHFPIQLLSEQLRYLQDLNRCKQNSARRFDLLERCTLVVVPVINSVFARYYKTHPLPEDNEKRELIILSCNVCNEMALGYMRLFEHDINLSMLRYSRTRNRISNCAHSLMEFTYAEQRLRILRYQDLADETWKNLNLIFTVLYCFEDIQYQKQSLAILQVTSLTSKKKSTQIAKSRIASIYISIQLNGCIDMFSMATHQSQIAASKVHQCAGQLTITENINIPETEDNIITHASHASAASISSIETDAMEFSINVALFRKNLQRDFTKIEELVSQTVVLEKELTLNLDSSPATIVSQEDVELRITLATILDRLNLHERAEERQYIGHLDPLFIFNGYKPCFSIMSALRLLQGKEGGEPTQDTDILEMLSQRSAAIADDHTKDESTRWLIANSSDSGVLAETRETRFTRSMFVGQLLLYGVGDITAGDFTLAYIARMHRDMGDKLQIAIINLSKQAELVVVQSDQLKKTAMGLPAMLLADYADGLGVVLHTSHRLQPGTSVIVIRSKEQYSYTIGSATVIRREFSLYQLVSG